MSRLLILSLLLPATAFAQAASGPDPVYGAGNLTRFVEGVDAAPLGSFYIGGYSGPAVEGLEVVHFYAMRDPDDSNPEGVAYTSVPLARRTIEAIDGSREERWADRRNCPALYGVLAEFADLVPPRFVTPRFYSEPLGSARLGGPGTTVHGTTIMVWGYAKQADGAPMSMTLTGTDGLVQRWQSFAHSQLDPCWFEGG